MDFNDWYDISLELSSLSKLKEGFPIIFFSEKGKYKYDKSKEREKVCVITAIGNSNTGKTYILSKISEIKLPFGHSISTRGISIKYPESILKQDTNQRYVIVDTEGSDNAITISEEDRQYINQLTRIKKLDKIINYFNDKKMTNDFIQHFALDSADIVIVVVGELTFQEQKFLNRIKKYCNGKKNLYVIHNLMFFERIEEVKNYMKNVIESSLIFHFEKRDKDYYVETIKNEKRFNRYIIHLIMGKEGSEAGKYYNQSTIQFIRKNISAIIHLQRFDVITRFSKYLCLYANEYFDLPQLYEKQSNFHLISRKNIEITDYVYKVNVPYDLKLKINDIDYIFENISNIPSLPYSYYKKDNKFIIQIEYFGKLEELKIKIKRLNRQYKFIIIGKTKENNINLNSDIYIGEFIICFNVGIDFMIIRSKEFQYVNDEIRGILNIIYEIMDFNLGSDEAEELGDVDDW